MVNKERILDNFKSLVALDSPSYNERLVCDWIKSYLAELGIEAVEDNAGDKIGGTTGNLYAYIDGGIAKKPILFSAHMDTVEPSHGKTAVFHEDGTITSDGTTVLGSDDLAGVVAILEGLTVLKENNLPHRPIELLLTVDEETHCGGSANFDYSKIKSESAYVFDMDGEPGEAASSAPSILSYKVNFLGKAAHAGFEADNGIHAIKAAAEAVTKIPCGNIDKGVTANVGIISGGKATNIIPDCCEITGEIRSFDADKVESRINEVIDICKTAAEKIGAEIEEEHSVLVKAFNTPDDTETVRYFKKVCDDLGMSGKTFPTFGGSDANTFAQHGIEGIVVSTGMNNCHAVNEYTTVNELVNASRLAFALMKN